MKNPDEAWFRFNVKTQEWEWSFDPPYKRHELKFTRLVSAEPTPREAYMRVAEAVREACAEQVMRTIVFDAIDVVRPGWHEQKATAARIVRDLDLAAVVAKALEVTP